MEGDVIELGLTRLKTAAEGTILHLEGGARVPFGDYLMSRWGPPRARRLGVPPYLEDIAVTAVLDKVDMSLVHLIEPALEPMTGLLRGKVLFAGRADHPELGAELQVLGARIGGRDLHPIQLTADLLEDRLRADFTLRPREGGALRARSEVTLPLRLQPLPSRDVLLGSEDLIAEVSGEGFPLDVLLAFVPGLTDEAGSLTLSGSVTGSLLRPRPDLELRVEGGRACARSLGICYANVLLASSLKSDRFDIAELWADTVPQVVNPIDIVRGRVRPAQRSGIGMKGSIGLDGWRPGDVEVQLTLAQPWLIYTREIQAQVDGEIGVRGTYPALAVSGDLDVQNVEIDLGQDAIGREVEQLTLPASLRVHRTSSLPGPGERKSGQADADPSLAFLAELRGAASARVGLHLTNNVNVSLAVGVAGQGGAAQAANLLGSVEPELILGGDLELLWDQGKGGAVGEIRTEKGSKLTVLTRSFAVEEGSSVEFVGAIPDAQLAIRAVQQSGQGDVAVVVSGQIGAPQIDFESDEFEDPADVMSVLLTGKPLSELSGAEGGSALGQITETLAGFGTRAFGKYVPVDRLALDIGDDISSGSVEAGKALSPWLFFLTRFRWGAEEHENRVEGQLEFRFDRRGYVEVRMGDRLIGSADVVWKIQF
jgi:autotransporter translocation and assembly factor TamB